MSGFARLLEGGGDRVMSIVKPSSLAHNKLRAKCIRKTL